jgi:hypothetical protein
LGTVARLPAPVGTAASTWVGITSGVGAYSVLQALPARCTAWDIHIAQSCQVGTGYVVHGKLAATEVALLLSMNLEERTQNQPAGPPTQKRMRVSHLVDFVCRNEGEKLTESLEGSGGGLLRNANLSVRFPRHSTLTMSWKELWRQAVICMLARRTPYGQDHQAAAFTCAIKC